MNWIRKWLGLEEDRTFLSDQIAADFRELRDRINHLELENRKYHVVTQQALGRIVAKLDPVFVQPDLPSSAVAWAERKAESDRLGAEALKRLKAEDWARRHTEGFPDAPPK